MEKIRGELSGIRSVTGAVSPSGSQISGSISGGLFVKEYDGPYEVTPTQETQVLATADRMLVENVVINPIPNNYGLITWNGSVLMVS